jgi:type IV pilus assembly protein PilM
MGNGSNKAVVGLDIQPGYVAAVEATPGRVAVDRAAYAPLAPGVVRDGEVVDVDTLSEVLRAMFAEHKLGKRVRLGVANQRIVMRTIDLPPLTDEKQIASAVRFQAQDHIPMPLDQAVLEHQLLGTVETEDGPRTRIVLVAARRDMIERMVESATRAGLRPHGIDLSAFALIRALHRADAGGTTLYVNVGGLTNLAIAGGTTCFFTRVIPQGVESIAAELAERRGLTLEHSHGWLKHVGLAAPVDGIEGESEIVLEARSALTEGIRRIGDEVRNSLDFYVMQDGSTSVERVVLSGPAVAIPGVSEGLGQQIGLPVEVGLVSEGKPGALTGIEAGSLAVATGLTIDEVIA